ncbi:hypothetical protein UNDKW_5075 [Undibacterium sp. KW1]|uniref:hypothetical protein n=1 Tax=Undibacterium sp. KW1 TaxID=2058624 RepID=UPI001331C5EC|nr:hypothetical protein [Undibacterium sp. KW1]BBB63348.1 hypothetical protein UNDKW_5075 [Undibacterium sp. KW1]
MKVFSTVVVMTALAVSGCATRQTTAQYREVIPENNFKGIVELPAKSPSPFMRDMKLEPALAADHAKADPVTMNYTWFYERGQTLGQHVDAWAHRYAFRFESRIPLGWDPYVQSDGSFVGNLYAAMEDLAYFSDEGRNNFHQYQDTKRLRAKSVQITVFEKERYIRIELRDAMAEAAEAQRDEQERIAAERAAGKTAFADYFRSGK